MSDKKESKFVREQRQIQAELVELKKMRQGITEAKQEKVSVDEVKVSKWKNFWYYNGVFIAIAVVLAVFVAFIVSQCQGTTHPDLTVVLYCNADIPSNTVMLMEEELARHCNDYNSDGEVYVRVVNCSVTSAGIYNEQGNAKATQLWAQFSNEEAIMFLVDDEYYARLKDVVANGFIDTTLGLPDKDGAAYKISNTDLMYVFQANAGLFTEIPAYLSKDYYIFLRATDNGTIIAEKDGVDDFADRAKQVLNRIMEAYPQKAGEN